ncbi:MAG: glycosyltransferase [Betaproteobacteria bacterium]|nr:glycosyltransferase [Betaproteobacteria bacterium]
MLQSRGHEVAEFTRHSDEIRGPGVWGSIKGAAATPWNPWSARAIRQAVARFLPDVVHVHNTFPLISPAIFHALAGTGVARVLTLHNYRLFCPAAIPMRAGKVCTDCLDRRSVLPALQHGCYRNSRLATVPLALNVALHRAAGTWAHQVDAFIALTEFQRQRVVDAGLPASRVFVKPNFYPGNPVGGALGRAETLCRVCRPSDCGKGRRHAGPCLAAVGAGGARVAGSGWRRVAGRAGSHGRWIAGPFSGASGCGRGSAADCPGQSAAAAVGVV